MCNAILFSKSDDTKIIRDGDKIITLYYIYYDKKITNYLICHNLL